MLFMLRLVAIAAFIFAANLNLFSQQDTSGWVQTGNNILLNKHEIGTILQAGLSTTGDSIWTFSDDDGYYFRIWELKSGMMVYEKTLSARYFISADFQTYHNNHPTDFKLYDLKSDSLLLNYKSFKIGHISPSASCHYDSNRKLLHVAFSYIFVQDPYYEEIKGMHIYRLSESLEFLHTFPIEIGFTLNHDFTRMAFPREEYIISIYDIVNQKYAEIGKTNLRITRMLFTSNPDYVSTQDAGNNLTIWDVNSQKMISKTPLKLFKLISYCFSDDDKFLAANANNRFYLIDMITGVAIDSTEQNDFEKFRFLIRKSHLGFVFITNNKFGLVNFDILGDQDIIQFAPDSSLIYTGNSATLHNLSNFDYDAIEWELSDGRTTLHPNPTLVFDSVGFYDVTLKLVKDGKEFKITKKNCIEVYPVLEVDFDSDIKYGKSPLTVQFEDKSSGIVDEYVWKVNDEVFSNEKNPQYVFTKSGRFNISLTVRDRLTTKVITKPYFIQVDRENIEFLEVLMGRAIPFWNPNGHVEHEDHIGLVQTIKQDDTLNIVLSLFSHVSWDNGSASFCFDGFLQVNPDDLSYYNLSGWETTLRISMYNSSVSNLSFNNNNFFYCAHGVGESYPSSDKNFTAFNKISKVENKIELNTKIIHFPMRYGKKVLSFDNDKLIVCGTSRLGQTNIYKFDSDFELFNQDSIQEFMIDAVNYDKNHFLMLTKDTVNSIYSLIYYDLNLEIKEIYPLSLPNEMVINSMLLLPENKLAIGGTIGNQTIGFLGVIDLKGNLLWHKTFPDWRNFNKLYLNRNNFFATGQNFDRDIGFVEIDQYGSDYIDNRLSNAFMNIAGLDILSDSVVILTYYISNELHLSKVRYKPLPQAPVSVENSFTISRSHSILPVPNPAENLVTLQFAESQIVRKVQVYDYSGIEVMQFTLPQSPVYEVQLPLHALSTGMYHVTVTTNSGILRTKFIKY
ncbi:MAG: PKD domain-containing protein [Candidatus Kapabacteria bacterium]|nr:PKD domain-containing protein [Candidatus Kapabacteria bacterium]